MMVVPAEYEELNSERVIAECAEAGLIVSFPADNELQIDLDTTEDWTRHERSWEIISREMQLPASARTVTPSRRKQHGKHVRIVLPIELSPALRIALQGALCSDPVRELLSTLRMLRGDPRPTLFIEAPGWGQSSSSATPDIVGL